MHKTILSREDATPELLFDVFSNYLARQQRTEETLVICCGLLLHHLGKIREPSEHGDLDAAVAELAEYMLLVTEAREQAMNDLAFLNARE